VTFGFPGLSRGPGTPGEDRSRRAVFKARGKRCWHNERATRVPLSPKLLQACIEVPGIGERHRSKIYASDFAAQPGRTASAGKKQNRSCYAVHDRGARTKRELRMPDFTQAAWTCGIVFFELGLEPVWVAADCVDESPVAAAKVFAAGKNHGALRHAEEASKPVKGAGNAGSMTHGMREPQKTRPRAEK